MHPRSQSRSQFLPWLWPWPSVARPLVALLLLLTTALAAPLAPAGSAAQATPVPLLVDCAAGGATPIAAAPATTAVFPLTTADALGRTFTFTEPPQRIVSLIPSNTEILFALGLGDRVVGVDVFSDFPAEAQEKPRVGDFLNPDLEGMVAADPDLVLATASHDASVLPALDRLGIPALAIEPTNLGQVLADIERIAAIAGVPERGRALACDLAERIAAVEAAVAGAERPRVFFEISTDLYTAGPGSFIDDLISRAGGANVAADAAIAWPQLSAEAVVAADPEVILLVDQEAGATPETVAARPGWGQIAAVRNGRVVNLAPDPVVRPGPRLVDGLEEMARVLHPDRFPEAGA
jgi:iron complex transport system substrate-binding protein